MSISSTSGFPGRSAMNVPCTTSFMTGPGIDDRELAASIHFLVDTPLDLVDWHIDHSKREDIRIVRQPTLEERQTHVLVPPSLRATVRWDRNPWAAVNGHPTREREPVFWLFPYWLGRYIGAIVE
jgi:hypothetical protein